MAAVAEGACDARVHGEMGAHEDLRSLEETLTNDVVDYYEGFILTSE